MKKSIMQIISWIMIISIVLTNGNILSIAAEKADSDVVEDIIDEQINEDTLSEEDGIQNDSFIDLNKDELSVKGSNSVGEMLSDTIHVETVVRLQRTDT